MLEPDELLPLELLPLLDELLPDDDMPLDELPLDELLPLELLGLPDVPPPPPLEEPPPPLDDPPPPLEEPPPPEELPPPPLDEGVPSVLLIDEELGRLLDDPPPELSVLDAVSVELSVGVPGSLELGLWLELRLDVPLPGGCWVVAQTGI